MYHDRVGAIILAAGSSSRLGTAKQLLHFRGESLLRHAALAALGAGCSPVVVTGARAEASRNELAGLDVREALNGEWQTGIASSIRAGIDGVLDSDPDVAATLVLLCDQPHVTAAVLSNLIAAWLVTRRPVVASAYAGTVGVPALFSRALFPELTQLEGGVGAKHVIEQHASEARFVAFPGGEVDVDTPADVARLGLSPPAGPP